MGIFIRLKTLKKYLRYFTKIQIKMQTATLILAMFLACANAGNIMDLIVDESQGGDIIAIDISGCDQDDVDECPAHKGGKLMGQLKFAPTFPAQSLRCQMYGVILGQDIPFPGGCPVTDVCANLASGDCPIEAGEEFVWNMEMPIESWFPGGSLRGKIQLQAPDEKEFVSFTLPIHIEKIY